MITRTVTLGGEEYAIRASTAAAIYYEQLTGKPVTDMEGVRDHMASVYAMVLANNRDKKVPGFWDFCDLLDDHPEVMRTVAELVLDSQARNDSVAAADADEESKKKD